MQKKGKNDRKETRLFIQTQAVNLKFSLKNIPVSFFIQAPPAGGRAVPVQLCDGIPQAGDQLRGTQDQGSHPSRCSTHKSNLHAESPSYNLNLTFQAHHPL